MIKRLFYILAIVLFASVGCDAFDINATDCDDADATTWCIQTTDSTITDADCGGSCDGGDTIYLEGGNRTVDLNIQASGTTDNYITITNYPSDERVVFNKQDNTPAILFTNDASWIDLRGDGLSGNDWVEGCTDVSCYGIVIQQEIEESAGSSMIRVQNSDSDNIKIGYIEIDATNNNFYGCTGIRVDSVGLSSAVTLSNYEIHHNYVHDTGYAGFYLGNNDFYNDPDVDGSPGIENFNVHRNLLEDLGTYGMTLKGIAETNTLSEVHNNIIRPHDRTAGNWATGNNRPSGTAQTGSSSSITLASGEYVTTIDGSRIYILSGACSGQNREITTYSTTTKIAGITPNWTACTPDGTSNYEIRGYLAHGITSAYIYGEVVKYYANRIEKTYGEGITIHHSYGEGAADNLEVFNNLILGVGEVDTIVNGNGIVISCGTTNPTIYNNTIIKPTQYGISTYKNCGDGSSAYHYDNLIVDPGISYTYEDSGDTLTAGAVNYANTEKATVAEVGFVTWLDDDDYSNDNFDLAAGHSVDAMGDETLTTDYDGNARVTPFDDGAYDYPGSVSPTYPIQGAAGNFKYN